MRTTISTIALTVLLADLAVAAPTYSGHTDRIPYTAKDDYYISLGPRPYYIIQNMTDSPLKRKLESCENGPFGITTWSIGHRYSPFT